MSGRVVPEVLNIVSCSTQTGRGVFVDSGDREAGNHVSRRQVTTCQLSRFALRRTSRCLEALTFVCPRLVCRRTLPQPGVSSTLRKKRREVVASRESNLSYPKLIIGVDVGSTPCGNFALSYPKLIINSAKTKEYEIPTALGSSLVNAFTTHWKPVFLVLGTNYLQPVYFYGTTCGRGGPWQRGCVMDHM